MKNFSKIYEKNYKMLSEKLRVGENFDLISRVLKFPFGEGAFFYIDGLLKEGEMQKIMQFLLKLESVTSADELLAMLPYVEVKKSESIDEAILAVLSGQSVMICECFGDEALILNLRSYPARQTEEPETDRVMQGARDGFVETLITNTALIRRRIRDPKLTMEHFSLGGSSNTDVVMCYLNGTADEKLISDLRKKLNKIKPKSLTLGYQSLAELLIKRGWYNPFPKIRTTERPDTAAAQILEGSIILLCDTSPLASILPTSLFDYLEESSDYHFPPLTGTYLRLVRLLMLVLSVVITPLWYMALLYEDFLPQSLDFLVPSSPGAIPIILQLFLAEIAIDGLKIASMNTPDILSNSLSVVGALLLGDFAVTVGWLSPDVILYMAFVAIANFAQQNHELGYALKFMRMLTLLLVFLFGIWGFILGLTVAFLLALTNTTVFPKKGYLYPLIPFNKKRFLHYFLRHQKDEE